MVSSFYVASATGYGHLYSIWYVDAYFYGIYEEYSPSSVGLVGVAVSVLYFFFYGVLLSSVRVVGRFYCVRRIGYGVFLGVRVGIYVWYVRYGLQSSREIYVDSLVRAVAFGLCVAVSVSEDGVRFFVYVVCVCRRRKI